MQFRKVNVIVLAVSLMLTNQSAIAATTVKAGQNCKTKNQITKQGNLQFKCVLVGKKLIWQKFTTPPVLQEDGYPFGVAAPNRTCLKNGDSAWLNNKELICQNGFWAYVVSPNTPSAVSPTPNPSGNTILLEPDGFPPNVPAPNRTCPNNGAKANAFGGSLTCTKGIWVVDPGSVITKPTATSVEPKPSATPSPSASPSASPTVSTTPISATTGNDQNRPSEVAALKAFNDVKEILQSAPNPKTTFNLSVSPNASKQLADNANATLPNSIKFWQNVYSPSKPVDVLLSSWSEKEWMINADKSAGDTVNGYEGMASWFDSKPQTAWQFELGSGVHEGQPVNGVTPKIIIVVSGPDAVNRPGGTTTWPHEYVHNVQITLAPTKLSNSPCWFIEGMAQFYGMALSYPNSSNFLKSREAILKDREYGAYPFDSQQSVSYWQNSMKNNEATPCGNYGGYWIGLLAVENLVSQKGTAGVISLLKATETSGSFSQAFQQIYGTDLNAFYSLQADYIHDVVDGLNGVAYKSPTKVSTIDNSSILSKVQSAITASKNTPTSNLIHVTIEPGALTSSQEAWIKDALQFINYLSPPTSGGDWTLVFPTTMAWFNDHWDMSKETQHYKDMFANNTAEQLVGSVHSYGTGLGWAASFFVSQNKNWFNSDWQMRFMAQLLKPIGYSSGIYGNKVPEWYTRMFAYPIGAAYSQLTSDGSYSTLRQNWITQLNTLPKPINLANYETADVYLSGAEALKMPGALAMEILMSKASIETASNFIKIVNDANSTWDAQLISTFGISKADLYAQVAALAS